MAHKSRLSRLLVFLLVAMFVVCFTVPAFAAASPAAKTSTQVIKVESAGELTQKAGLYSTAKAAKVQQYLAKGTKITVVAVSGSRVKVKLANGKTGFVLAKYIKVQAVTAVKPQVVPVSLTISAAASLTDAMNEVQKLYKAEKPNVTITFNFGSSGSLMQQIEQGAPVDAFIAAASKQMDELQDKKLLAAGTRKVLVKNHLVLIAPKDSDKVKSLDSLTNSDVKVIASGESASVPAGKYTQESLTNLKLWDKVQPKLVLGKDVRQVLTYVESGNADAGFVYTTDALTSDKVKVITTLDEKTHSPIVYPAAVINNSKNQQAAKDFIAFLSGTKAKAVFEKYGFVVGE